MLQDQFDISMDWMILNRGPMRYSVKIKETEMEKESQRLKEEAKRLERMNERAVKFAELQEVMPDAPELLEYMAKDPELRHQLLLQFYKYKKQNSGPIMENHT
ncbi:MAG: hypothetical protein GY940_44905 [bacterium]|nr:hypothetical protein [bacterium]